MSRNGIELAVHFVPVAFLVKLQLDAVVPLAVGIIVSEPRAEGAVARLIVAHPLAMTLTPARLQAELNSSVAPSRMSLPDVAAPARLFTLAIGNVDVPRTVSV